jgi:hypothetical protein
LLSKRIIESRFPGSTYWGSHPYGSWMHLILMILNVGLSSFFYCVFSLRYVQSDKWCNLYLSLPWISEDC